MSADELEPKVISTGNEELDVKLGGGFPHPSLILVEGPHGTGKTVLVQQFIKGALDKGYRVVVVTTESTTRDYVVKSRNVGIDLTGHFLLGRLRIYSAQLPGARWVKRYASLLLPLLGSYMTVKQDTFDILVVDTLSHLAIYTTPSHVLDFFNRVRILAEKGKTVILTLHPGILREDLATRARAICDGYIKLSSAVVGGRAVKIMNIVKLRGAPTTFESTITYDVDPAFGIKLIPIALAKA